MATLAQRYGSYLCSGMIEQAGSRFYNTAILFDKRGRILIRHGKLCEKPPFFNGRKVYTVESESGRLSLLLCGDLFLEDIGRRMGKTDLCLIPMARSFSGRSP